MLALVTLIDLSLLLAALRNWQVYRLASAGAALPLLPYAFGLLVVMAALLRSGRADSGWPPTASTAAGLRTRAIGRAWPTGTTTGSGRAA